MDVDVDVDGDVGVTVVVGEDDLARIMCWMS